MARSVRRGRYSVRRGSNVINPVRRGSKRNSVRRGSNGRNSVRRGSRKRYSARRGRQQRRSLTGRSRRRVSRRSLVGGGKHAGKEHNEHQHKGGSLVNKTLSFMGLK